MITGNGYGSGPIYDGRLLYDGAPLYRATNFYSTGSEIPDGAIVYWDFTQTNLDEAQLEQVGRESLLIPSRASNANIIQSSNGSIVTYTENEPAFNKGVGLRDEGEATNLFPDSQDYTQASWAKSATRLEVVASAEPSPFAGVDMQVMQTLAETGQNYVRKSFTVSGDGINSVFVKRKNYRYVYIGFLGMQNIFDFDTGAFTVNTENATATKVGDSWRISATTDFAGLLRFATIGIPSSATTLNWDVAPDAGLGVYIMQSDFVESKFISSPIVTNTMAATRAASNNQIPCLVENGVWSVGGVVLGDFDVTAGWTMGVRDDGYAFNFTGDTVNGTFYNLLAAGIISARLIGSGGRVIEVESLVNASQFLSTSHPYSAAEVMESFAYPNPFSIQFITSDYWIGVDFAADTAVLDTLMDDAGYDVPSLGVAEQWPLTDFIFEIDFIFRGSEAGSNARVFERANSGADRFLILMADDRARLLIAGTGVSASTDANVLFTPVIGTRYVIRVTVDSAGNNNTLEVVGVGSDTDTSCTGSVSTTLPGTGVIAGSPYTALPINADTATITITINQPTEGAGDFDFGDFDENDFG